VKDAGQEIRRVRRILGLGGSLFIAVLVLGVTVTLWIDYRETLVGAERTALALTRTLDEHVVHATGQVDTVLFALTRRLADAGGPVFSVDETLGRWVAHLPHVPALLVVDAAGRPLHRSGQAAASLESLTAREAFRKSLAVPGDTLKISAPLSETNQRQIYVAMSRPIDAAKPLEHRRFVTALVEAPDLSAFYGALDVGPASTLGIYHRSGALIASAPVAPGKSTVLSDPAAAGLIRAAGAPVGVVRITTLTGAGPHLIAYRYLERGPFVVAVALDETSVLQPWHHNAVRMIGFVGIACLALIAALILLLRHISQRYRAEAALRQSERRFRSIFDHAAVGVALLSTNRQPFTANHALARMLGCPPEALTQAPLAEIIDPDDVEIEDRLFRSLLAGDRESFTLEKRFRRADGSIIWGRLSASLGSRDTGTGAPEIIAVIEDVTDRKRAEAELASRFRRERLMRAVSESLVALLPEDMDSRVTDALGMLAQFLAVDRAFLYEAKAVDGTDADGDADPRARGDDRDRLHPRYQWTRPTGAGAGATQRHASPFLPTVAVTWLHDQVTTHGSASVTDLSALPADAEAERRALADAGIEAVLLMPIWSGWGLQGCIGVAHGPPGRPWAPADLDLLAIIGQIITVALDRGRVLKEVRNQRLWLETLINAMPDIVCFKDGQGRWLVANEFGLRLFRLTDIDYRGKTDRQLAGYAEAYRDSLLVCADTDEIAWLAGRPSRGEETISRPGTSPLVFDVIKVPLFNTDGSRKGLVVVGRDITRRKQFERELQAANDRIEVVLNSIDAIIYVADMETREVIMVNDTARHTFGDGIGQTCWEFLGCGYGPEDCDACRPERLLHPDGTPAAPHIWELFHRGNRRWYLCRDRAIRWSDGRLVRLEMATDITERKIAERQLSQAKQQAEAASQAKSRFLATMSHELRTPLNSILGFSEMIQNQLLGPIETQAYVEYAEHINVSGRHLLDLISDILDLSKIEAGKFELEVVPLSIPHLVHSVLSLTRERARRQELSLDTDLPADLLPLYGDERAAKQILFNLVSNALKYTKSGGHVVVGAWSDPDGSVTLTVADTGIGIPEDQINRVLRPFEQADNRYSRAFGGTGLGLSLVKGLVELHGGTLRLDSTQGRGTVVSVRFPPKPLSKV